MERLHYHCQNCAPNPNVLNVTCIEELKERVNNNLVTQILRNYDCGICYGSLNNFKNSNNPKIKVIRQVFFWTYNYELIKAYGYFLVNIKLYKFNHLTNNWTKIDKKVFFDSIKEGSLLLVSYPCCQGNEINKELNEKINEKGYTVNLINLVEEHCQLNYFRIEKPTMTKPAIRKYNY